MSGDSRSISYSSAGVRCHATAPPDGLTTTIYAAGGSFEKINRSDGSQDAKTYVGGFAISSS